MSEYYNKKHKIFSHAEPLKAGEPLRRDRGAAKPTAEQLAAATAPKEPEADKRPAKKETKEAVPENGPKES